MKKILFFVVFSILLSCEVPSNHQHFDPIVTGVVRKIGISGGKYQDFIVTIQDTNGAFYETETKEITYSVGDTVTLKIE